MYTCSEIMTRDPVCCLPTETVARAAQLMKVNDIGSLPVVENEKTRKLVGIVTDRDLVLDVLAAGRSSRKTKVEEIMTRDVLSCHPDDDLQQALDAMRGYQRRRIPVVDGGNRILGIISQADLATRLEEPVGVAGVVKEVSQPNVFLMQR